MILQGFWLEKFEELSAFNADADKSKYTSEYLYKMRLLQKEYDDRLVRFATANGHIIPGHTLGYT